MFQILQVHRLVRQWRYRDSTVNWYKHNVWIRISLHAWRDQTRMQIGWKETPLKSDCPPSSRPSSQRVFRLVGKNIRSNESSFARASSDATFIYILFVAFTSCDFQPWQLWKINWIQNTSSWKKRVKKIRKSDSSQSLRTLSLVAKPTGPTA